MKKAICLSLLVLALMFCLCGCQTANEENINENDTTVESVVEENNNVKESLKEKLINEIEDAYLKEESKYQDLSTVQKCELSEKYTKKWEYIADEYYNKLMEYDDIIPPNENYYSSDDLHTFVSNMKTNWEQYSKTQCENYLKTLETIYGAGTIVGPMYADYEYEMQKEWALQLVCIYEQLNIE